MTRDWYDFKCLHSNFAGTRIAFENACETLIRVQYPDKNVKSVRINQGDGGIDIFLGNLGVDAIDVFQCKFFLDNIGQTQKVQINKSFVKAITAKKYKMKSWTLCLPKELDLDEHDWYSNWKSLKESEYNLVQIFINIFSGNQMIDLMKSYGIYNRVFQIEDSLKIEEIHAATVGNESPIMQLKRIEEIKLKLSVKPELYINGVRTSGSDSKLEMRLNNRGENALIENYVLQSDDIKITTHFLPIDLKKGNFINIYGGATGTKHITNCDYIIEIIYYDKLKNKYITKIEGKGSRAKITETKGID